MAALRALTVLSILLLVAGAALVAWSIAPPAAGFDTPRTVLDKRLTGSAGNTFPKEPFAKLEEPSGRYRLEVTSEQNFVIGQRRADREPDAIAQDGADASTAGGDPSFYFVKEFQSTARSDAPAAPEAGPQHFWIKFPDATAGANPAYKAVATFLPTWATPFVTLKAWSSIVGLIVAALGLLLFLVRAAWPQRRAEAP